MSVFMRGGSPFASSGASPWRNRDTSFGVNATAAAIRDAINTPSAWGYSAHNLLLRSQEFDNSYWAVRRTTKSANVTAAPDGTLTADAIVETAETNTHQIFNDDSGAQRISITSGQTYVFSVYLKKGDGSTAPNWVNIGFIEGFASLTTVAFNVSTGVVGASASATGSIVSVGNGWYRCSISATANLTTTSGRVKLAFTNNADVTTEPSYLGATTSNIFIWGAQVNVGPTALDYVATTSAALGPTTPGYAIPGFAGARINAAARTSVAMQQRVDGVWEFAPHNLLTFSEQFDNGAWSKASATVTADAVSSPISTATADAIVEDATSNVHRVSQAVSVTSGQLYTVSVYVKKATTQYLQIAGSSPTFFVSGNGAWFDLDAETASAGTSTTASITNVGSGWYRVSVTMTAQSSGSTSLFFNPSPSGSNPTYQGVLGRVNAYLWGAQVNAGPAATTYVPTATQAVYAPAIDWLSGIGAYGLRSEPEATNQVRNSAAVGGTSPTNWSVAQVNGITVTATSSGTMQGLPGVSYRVQGTATAGGYNAGIAVESNTGLAATSGQTWATSVFVALTSGSLLTSTVRLSQWESTDVGGFVAATRSTVRTVTGSLSRIEFINTLAGGATVARMQPRIEFLITNGETYDFTVFVACPQAELTSATSPILTYGASATRAADTLTVPDTAAGFIGQTMGTLAVEAVPKVIGNNGTLAINSANSTNDIDLRTNTVAQVTVGGSLLMSPSITAATANALSKAALAYTLRSSAASRNGAAATLTGDAPAFTQVQIGGYDGSTTGNLNGHITRVRVTQDVLTPAALAAISA